MTLVNGINDGIMERSVKNIAANSKDCSLFPLPVQEAPLNPEKSAKLRRSRRKTMDSAKRKRPAGGANYGKKRNAGASGKRQDQKKTRANSSSAHGNKRFERPKKRTDEWRNDSDFEKERTDKPRSKPRSDKPRSDKPGYDKPRSSKPRSDKPRSDKPGYDKPRSDKPSYDKPGYDKPGYDKPRSGKPRSDKPGYDKPDYDKPRSARPRSDKPGYDKPGYDKPRSARPRSDKPGYDKPGYDKPRSARPGYDKPRYERTESSEHADSDRPFRDRTFRDRDRDRNSDSGQSREFRPAREFRGEKSQDKKAPNVHLSISPRLIELAEIMAEESEMPLQEYLEKCMVLVLKTHAQKLGLNKRSFVTEYTKEHSKKPEVRVSTRKKD